MSSRWNGLLGGQLPDIPATLPLIDDHQPPPRRRGRGLLTLLVLLVICLVATNRLGVAAGEYVSRNADETAATPQSAPLTHTPATPPTPPPASASTPSEVTTQFLTAIYAAGEWPERALDAARWTTTRYLTLATEEPDRQPTPTAHQVQVSITTESIDGLTATTEATITAGEEHTTGSARLVMENGSWKVDEWTVR